jgi:hypothetical protein
MRPDDRLVRIALQRWFSRICEDNVLLQSGELRAFIEADFAVSPSDMVLLLLPTPR